MILCDCPWKDLEGMGDRKALPDDAKPIRSFEDADSAWHQVYRGLKEVIDEFRGTFTIRDEFRREMETTEFLSQEGISLQRIFEFPNLVSYAPSRREGNIQKTLRNENELLSYKYVLVHGERLCGKTALCRHLFLKQLELSVPVIYVDLDTIGLDAKPHSFHEAYRRQFHGDYSLWEQQKDKVIILDNLSRDSVDHVTLAVPYVPI